MHPMFTFCSEFVKRRRPWCSHRLISGFARFAQFQSFAEDLPNRSNRPVAALQDRPRERPGSAGKRSFSCAGMRLAARHEGEECNPPELKTLNRRSEPFCHPGEGDPDF